MFADRPVRVGDFYHFGDRVGTVEEIGLRSTRVRSLDRTVVTIPNAEFSTMQLENYTERDQVLLKTNLQLRYETIPEQLRFVLAELRKLLLAHPKVAVDPARVRFTGFAAYALELEVFAYVRSNDWNEFLGIREDIFLRMFEIVMSTGASFAFPSQVNDLARDNSPDDAKVRQAEARVQAWREAGILPFPNFTDDYRLQLKDTLDFPPQGSTEAQPEEPKQANKT